VHPMHFGPDRLAHTASDASLPSPTYSGLTATASHLCDCGVLRLVLGDSPHELRMLARADEARKLQGKEGGKVGWVGWEGWWGWQAAAAGHERHRQLVEL